jgi:hypothetical protein
MRCGDCQEALSEYIDGSLELGELTNIERHLADCETCRAVRDDLLQIVHFSHQLPMHAPSSSLWSRIADDLKNESPPTFWSRLSVWWLRLRSSNLRMTIPQLAASAAAAVILMVAGTTLLRTNGQGPVVDTAGGNSGEQLRLSNGDMKDMQQIEDQILKLSENLERRKESWDPEIRQAFEKNLYYVNQCLVDCRFKLNDNPSDNVARELMLNAYREKFRLLDSFDKF